MWLAVAVSSPVSPGPSSAEATVAVAERVVPSAASHGTVEANPSAAEPSAGSGRVVPPTVTVAPSDAWAPCRSRRRGR